MSSWAPAQSQSYRRGVFLLLSLGLRPMGRIALTSCHRISWGFLHLSPSVGGAAFPGLIPYL